MCPRGQRRARRLPSGREVVSINHKQIVADTKTQLIILIINLFTQFTLFKKITQNVCGKTLMPLSMSNHLNKLPAFTYSRIKLIYTFTNFCCRKIQIETN